MVKQLRRKFVLTAMLSLFLILIAIIGVINILNFRQIQTGADEALDILAENEGLFPDMRIMFIQRNGNMPPQMQGDDKIAYNRSLEMPFQTRYFQVQVTSGGEAIFVDTSHTATVTVSKAQEIAKNLLSKANPQGDVRGYYDVHYRYLIHNNSDGSLLFLFLDCSKEIYDAKRLLLRTLLIGVVSLVGMFILVYLFSGKAVAPVVESLEKQKRFITDAGHELKTPLAVISANVDVLELESGKSEWTDSIRGQIKRMNGLVKNMLTLTRMEEESIQLVFADVDLGNVIAENASSFKSVAESKGINYITDIAEDIHIKGDKNSINQLSSLLVDNALKYCSDKGMVSIRVGTDDKKKKAVFEVANTCDSIPEGNLDRLFDRFYRGDSSRSRETGGYGIGLSVARAIATSHQGTIEAKRDGDHMIRFIVQLPINKQ